MTKMLFFRSWNPTTIDCDHIFLIVHSHKLLVEFSLCNFFYLSNMAFLLTIPLISELNADICSPVYLLPIQILRPVGFSSIFIVPWNLWYMGYGGYVPVKLFEAEKVYENVKHGLATRKAVMAG